MQPLIPAAEKFIEKVLKNVGRQHVDVEQLTPHDLDQLSRLIADALQVVEQDQGPRLRQGPRDVGGEMAEDEDEAEEGEEKTLEDPPTLKPRGGAEGAAAELQGS